jgi:ABC-type multidrug transport system fused ATPase/permease subunit
VPQDIYLLDDSIKNNIAFGENQNQIDTHKINEVINLSQLKDVISNLEKKEETFVGDKAVRISGGQKQRIGIARSLYFNRKILVFDEATNAIDADNEKKIISNIVDTNKNKTIIYISHNHETIKNFDKIIYLDKGKIVDIGKYDNLNAKYNFSKISN